MAYIPDWCSYKFTPGQMARMISQVKNEKDYIYCNYADVEDPMFANVPCASTATSPNCGSAAPLCLWLLRLHQLQPLLRLLP